MIIGFVLDSNIDFPGGVQRFVKGLYRFVIRSGHRAVIFTGGKEGVSEKEGYEIRRLGRTMLLPGNDTEVSIFADWADSGEIKSLVEKEKVDVLHLQAIFGILGMRFLDCSDLSSVGTFHNFWETERLPAAVKMFFPLIRHYVNKLDVRIADSKTALELISEVAPGDYSIIPPGVDVARFREASPKRCFPEKLVQILYVGRLDERKGLFYLLESFKMIKEHVSQVALAVIGRGPLQHEAEEFIREENLSDVKLLGFVDDEDLPAYFKGADVFCSPATHGESFGIVLLEAMAAGLPVVAFNNPGYCNVLTNGGERFLVNNRDVEGLALAISKLVLETGLREEMSEWSSREVEKYDWSVVGGKYLDVYTKLVERGS